MKILTRILFYLILCTALLSSCRKQTVDQLPPITHTGANTFGCLLNGKAWIPAGGGGGLTPPTGGGFFGDAAGGLNIYIEADSEKDYFNIYLNHISTTGTYMLNTATDVRPYDIFPKSYGAYFLVGVRDYYVTTPIYTGTVVITYADSVQGIVAGTFEMKLYRQSTNEVLNITGGRFDYKNH